MHKMDLQQEEKDINLSLLLRASHYQLFLN